MNERDNASKDAPALDFIGDIHGHHDKLTTLLSGLGYERSNGTFRHPQGRKVVFLGDYIDRGPKIRDLGALALPEPMRHLDHPLRQRHLRKLPNYTSSELPVFFGHYWLPPHLPRQPLAPNLACLDYSGAMHDNPLTAYRWDGEAVLRPEKFVGS